jgi:GNAT superfamily N-acetyltransferase
MEPIYRRGTAEDALACHELMWSSVTDLGTRQGTPLEGTAAEWWQWLEPLNRLLVEEAAEWWVAELPASRPLVGFARSIERDGLFELTEFFVRPDQQSKGIGSALIERTFPAGRGKVRSIIATADVRAQTRYYAAGTVARFPLYTLGGAPTATAPGPDLGARIDRGSSDHPRPARDRTEGARASTFRRRDGLAPGSPPRASVPARRSSRRFLVRGTRWRRADGRAGPTDLPAILLHAEDLARSMGVERLELQVPAPNDVAVRHLLTRGFRLQRWINFLMSDRPFGQFDRFIPFSPPLFL